MGREHQEGRINWITAIVMGLFHVGAIAALFCFSWKNLAAFAIMYFFAINVGIGMCLPPPAHAPRLPHPQVARVLHHRLRHHGARGRTHLLGRHPPRPSSELRPRRRPAHPARRHLVGSRRLDHLRPRPALRDRAARPLRPRPHPRQGPRLALQVPLASRSSSPACCRSPSAPRSRPPATQSSAASP